MVFDLMKKNCLDRFLNFCPKAEKSCTEDFFSPFLPKACASIHYGSTNIESDISLNAWYKAVEPAALRPNIVAPAAIAAVVPIASAKVKQPESKLLDVGVSSSNISHVESQVQYHLCGNGGISSNISHMKSQVQYHL